MRKRVAYHLVLCHWSTVCLTEKSVLRTHNTVEGLGVELPEAGQFLQLISKKTVVLAAFESSFVVTWSRWKKLICKDLKAVEQLICSAFSRPSYSQVKSKRYLNACNFELNFLSDLAKRGDGG